MLLNLAPDIQETEREAGPRLKQRSRDIRQVLKLRRQAEAGAVTALRVILGFLGPQCQ